MKINVLLLLVVLINISCSSKIRTTDRMHGNRIGFFDENSMSLCVLNENDGSIKSLVNIEESSSGLYRRTVWSPDGSQFAFTGTVDGVRGTYIVDADGSNRELVLKPKGKSDEGVLEWHRDLKLIFVLKNIDGNAEIYSVKDSLNLTNLTKSPSWEFFPTVFPDGRIAFVSNIDEKESVENSTFKDVYVLDPDSTGFKFLLSLEGMSMESVSTTGIFPDISPDGKLMCFTLKGDIYIIDTDGKNSRNITDTPNLTELTPSFSLDGKSIVYSGASQSETDFLSGNKPTMNLFKIDLQTLEKEQLTFGENNYFTHPLYQPY
ncbi:PD40 domain-containing protein [Algoriphagus sp. Y33]|uniref:PD40 domain-containing protein n=1 Tax=Algoriphagus sp. Y33 TaxID=2772483 RepID=UPI001781C003|nr:PD40 domain-containing protein [Algoriphagus sp. Y33]